MSKRGLGSLSPYDHARSTCVGPLPVDETTGLAAGVVSLRSVAVTVLLALDQPPLELTAYARNEYVLL
jgi:hypothetical protein